MPAQQSRSSRRAHRALTERWPIAAARAAPSRLRQSRASDETRERARLTAIVPLPLLPSSSATAFSPADFTPDVRTTRIFNSRAYLLRVPAIVFGVEGD